MNCIIIEDEIPAQRVLKNYLQKIPDVHLMGSFQTAFSAHTFLKENNVDVVLLDINLPDIPGIDFIKTVKHPPQVIFTTAYPDYAVSSFELETIVDYLVKPFSFDRFLKAISKAEKLMNREALPAQESVFINVDKTLHKLILNDILYIESDRNYISFITTDKKLTIIDSLKNWKEILDTSQFIQIHKSFIVNVRKINKYTSTHVYIQNEKISIGRTYKEAFQVQIKPKR